MNEEHNDRRLDFDGMGLRKAFELMRASAFSAKSSYITGKQKASYMWHITTGGPFVILQRRGAMS